MISYTIDVTIDNSTDITLHPAPVNHAEWYGYCKSIPNVVSSRSTGSGGSWGAAISSQTGIAGIAVYQIPDTIYHLALLFVQPCSGPSWVKAAFVDAGTIVNQYLVGIIYEKTSVTDYAQMAYKDSFGRPRTLYVLGSITQGYECHAHFKLWSQSF